MSATGNRHIVEGHGTSWFVTDLGEPDKTGPRYLTRDEAQRQADQLNTPRARRAPQQAQTALFDTQEVNA